ncbi:hypothetical protein DFP72DRAFT_935989 [Ephemerocybe angulata]|uniref:F-box domain-containing protein n=1 Tax=Ephemerocybe angulata TaxID=980116 RepID=A0A8H6HB44_9AGAR|nr:hypothetical protein DFP72DRAFT_935989 [Tulosesus angulatus]
MSSATFESQIELDREIARLEHDLVILKRRRNALSPVFRIPPELLSNIFFLALRFLEANGVTPQKLNPNVTKQAICAVSHQWRETAFAEPKLWMEIHVRDSTTTKYLDLIGKNLRKNQEVYVEATGIHRNHLAVLHILALIKSGKTRLKRLVINTWQTNTICNILQASSLRFEETATLELSYRFEPHGGGIATTQDIAAVFPHIRELQLLTKGLPNTLDVLRLPYITDLSLVVRYRFAREDIHQFFNILKSAKHLVYFTLFIEFEATGAIQDDVLWSTAVELPRLRGFKLNLIDSTLLLALLKPLRFHGDMEKVVITSRDTRKPQLSHSIVSTIILAFPHRSAPEIAKVREVTDGNSGEDLPFLICYQVAWMDRQDHSLEIILPVLQDDYSSSALPGKHLLSLMDSGSWMVKNVQNIEVVARLNTSSWECIAKIATIRYLSVSVWHLDDWFLRTLRGSEEGQGDPHNQAQTLPFPALFNLEIDMEEAEELKSSGLRMDIEYARALAQALKARAVVAGRDEAPQISKLEFVSCTSPLDGETRDLLSSVALEVLWKMRK